MMNKVLIRRMLQNAWTYSIVQITFKELMFEVRFKQWKKREKAEESHRCGKKEGHSKYSGREKTK